jgi:hypothetical protein
MKPGVARRLLAERSCGRCEVCGVRPAREAQHRKNRSQGGKWDLSNLLHVCGHGNTDGCHGFIHQHPTTAYANGWSVRQPRSPAEIPAWAWSPYGRIYVWLHDDGTTSPVEIAGLIFGAMQAEIIYERGTA